MRPELAMRPELTVPVGSVWTLLYDVFNKDDTYLAFLPLAHILEFVVENSFVFAGMPIGYGRVKTLTDASVRECRGDLSEYKPVRESHARHRGCR